MKIRIGISTCPNDTFAFFGLMQGFVDRRGIDYEFELLDVQQLNQRLIDGDFEVAKASFHAALLVADRYRVFSAGSALGFGNGPLLLAAEGDSRPDAWESGTQDRREPVVLCPGQHTTAYLLYRLFYPGPAEVRQVVFSEIMPALRAKTADFGVCIHEGRFTYRAEGLSLVEDLGQRWEKETGVPLPLGGILGDQKLGDNVLSLIDQTISDSVQYGLAHRQQALPFMQKYAQELDPDVVWAHVDLYVNQWTEHLGAGGKKSLDVLAKMAVKAGVMSHNTQLRIVGLDSE